MNAVQHATMNQFVNDVLRADVPVLVDFYATWCPPCQMLAPVLDRLANEFAGKVNIVKINIDEERGLADHYRINAVPTLMLFRDGKPVERFEGALPANELRAVLENAAPAPKRRSGG